MVAQRRSPLLLAAVSALLLALTPACGGDGDGTVGTTTTTSTTVTEDTTTTTEAPTTVVRAYFLRAEKVGPVAREAVGDGLAAEAMEGLLDGPTAEEEDLGFATTIPDGTELLGVTVADRVATVDLSAEFATGGGSLSMTGRVAQVVYTLTQLDSVDGVRFELEGDPVTALGGEGVDVSQPQTRADWESLTPAILVEAPLPFEEVTSPIRVTGTANTFEAVFQLNVTDGEGLIVYDQPQMATSGTGTRGTFDVTVTVEIPRPGVGAVIVFVHSPRDGSPVDVVEIPVRVS